MTEQAKITKKRGKTVYITLQKKSACDTCKACVFGKGNSITMPAISKIDCEVGDTVTVQMPKKEIPFASVILYAMPLMFMLLGAFIGMRFSEQAGVVLSFVFLVISVFFAYLIDRYKFRKNPDYNPVIVEIIEKADKEPL